MGFGDPLRDRQAQTGAAGSTGRIELDEAVEDPGAVSFGDASAAIDDTQDHTCARGVDVDHHPLAGRCVVDGVLQQVDEQAPQELFVAPHRHVGVAGRDDGNLAVAKSLADAEAARAQVVAARAAAGAVAGRSVVTAPFAGIVVKRFHNAGDQVDSAAGDPVLQLVDTDRLEVAAAVPLADVVRVKAGAAARLASMSAATPGLTVVSPPVAVDTATPTASVRLHPGRPLGLPLGLPVQVTIDAEVRRGVVLVPTVAIVRDAQEAAVFIAKDGRAERHVVMVGLVDGAAAEIRSGVMRGDAVIVDGQAGLPDGAAVRAAVGTPGQDGKGETGP